MNLSFKRENYKGTKKNLHVVLQKRIAWTKKSGCERDFKNYVRESFVVVRLPTHTRKFLLHFIVHVVALLCLTLLCGLMFVWYINYYYSHVMLNFSDGQTETFLEFAGTHTTRHKKIILIVIIIFLPKLVNSYFANPLLILNACIMKIIKVKECSPKKIKWKWCCRMMSDWFVRPLRYFGFLFLVRIYICSILLLWLFSKTKKKLPEKSIKSCYCFVA